jgi:hypothetical protein
MTGTSRHPASHTSHQLPFPDTPTLNKNQKPKLKKQKQAKHQNKKQKKMSSPNNNINNNEVSPVAPPSSPVTTSEMPPMELAKKAEAEAEARAMKEHAKKAFPIIALDKLIRQNTKDDDEEVYQSDMKEVRDPESNISIGEVRTIHIFEAGRNVTVTYRIDRRKSDFPKEQGYGILIFGACIYRYNDQQRRANKKNMANNKKKKQASKVDDSASEAMHDHINDDDSVSIANSTTSTTVGDRAGGHKASKDIRKRGESTATARFNIQPHVFVFYWYKTGDDIIFPIDAPEEVDDVPVCEMNAPAIAKMLRSWIRVCGVSGDRRMTIERLVDICKLSQVLNEKSNKKKKKQSTHTGGEGCSCSFCTGQLGDVNTVIASLEKIGRAQALLEVLSMTK